MARAYRDSHELAVTPVDPAANPLVEPDSVILEGSRHPAVAGPVPIMLAPGSEYLIRCVVVDDEHVWTLSRRAATTRQRVVRNHDGA